METLAEIKDFDYLLKKNKNIERILNDLIYYLRITSHRQEFSELDEYDKKDKRRKIIKAIFYLEDEIRVISEKLKLIKY
jgi:hypothetical protein